MSVKYWTGAGVAVAQVSTVTFGTYDATTTRSITIGGVVISAVDSGGNLTAALTALAVLLNASTHPYFAAVTWSSNATQIIGTADTLGCPFVFSGSVAGGTGTVSGGGVMADTTANAGPNVWSTAANWSDGAVPADTDTIIFKDSAINLCWGISLATIEPAKLRIDQTYTGTIGLARDFATSADGGTVTDDVQEYRDAYLILGPVLCEIGQNFGAASASGSGRIKIDFQADATTCTVFNTASSATDTGQCAVQLKFNEATSVLIVRSAPGGVGVAIGPGETSTLSKISVADITSTSKVFCGPGVTLTTWEQKGGTNYINLAATITTVTVDGGTLTTEGAAATTTMNIYNGTVYSNSTGTITTLNVNGTSAVADFQGNTAARTVSTLNFTKGTLKADGTVITITTFNDPASTKYVLTAA